MTSGHLEQLETGGAAAFDGPAIGVFATADPRLDEASCQRAVNITAAGARALAGAVSRPDGRPVRVVWSPLPVYGEREADIVGTGFRARGVEILVCLPDTWAFPQPSLLSLLAHFPPGTPLNITCGNSGPKPGVVFTHAAAGALAQAGRLVHINVGTWPDTGPCPPMSAPTLAALVDWCQAAFACRGLRGRRVVVFGHDSMGMETALAHVIPTRDTFGLEITRLDMKLVADLLRRQAWDPAELAALRAWVDRHAGDRLELKCAEDDRRFNECLALYLVVRDLLADLNAVGGGFMSQLEWGSDPRGLPLPVADVMESFFNSTFDHRGPKAPLPFATEADVQGLLTMLAFTWLTAGQPPLFMDFRKVWEADEIAALAARVGVKIDPDAPWARKGFFDGDNSGSAAFDWAARPGADVAAIMSRVSFPLADPFYFPGGGNSVSFISPGGIRGIVGRLCYHAPGNAFSLLWDEAGTVAPPAALAAAAAGLTTPTWPHTFVTPVYADMLEYKHYAPANHLHMTRGLSPARLEYWLDLVGVRSLTPWRARPPFIPGTDRPRPLLSLLAGPDR